MYIIKVFAICHDIKTSQYFRQIILLCGEYEGAGTGHEAAGPTAGHQGPQDVAATTPPPPVVTPRLLLYV